MPREITQQLRNFFYKEVGGTDEAGVNSIAAEASQPEIRVARHELPWGKLQKRLQPKSGHSPMNSANYFGVHGMHYTIGARERCSRRLKTRYYESAGNSKRSGKVDIEAA
jgi:hypothetical protein